MPDLNRDLTHDLIPDLIQDLIQDLIPGLIQDLTPDLTHRSYPMSPFSSSDLTRIPQIPDLFFN
tara:strand:+ start:210 stop:401 length:192 start_codon:yes stop_codon:yes gene_type:complete